MVFNRSAAPGALPPVLPEEVGEAHRLRAEVMKVNAIRASLEREVAQAQADVMEMEGELADFRTVSAERDTLRKQVEQQQPHSANAVRIKTLEAFNLQLRTEAQENKANYDTAAAEVHAMSQRIAALEEANNGLQQQLRQQQRASTATVTQTQQVKAEYDAKYQMVFVEKQKAECANLKLEQSLAHAESTQRQLLQKIDTQKQTYAAEYLKHEAEVAALRNDKKTDTKRPATPPALMVLAYDASQVVGCYVLQQERHNDHPVWGHGDNRLYCFNNRWTVGHVDRMGSGGAFLRSAFTCDICPPHEATWQKFDRATWAASKSQVLATFFPDDVTTVSKLAEVLKSSMDAAKRLRSFEGVTVDTLHAKIVEKLAATAEPYCYNGIQVGKNPAIVSLYQNFVSADSQGTLIAEELHCAYLRYLQVRSKKAGGATLTPTPRTPRVLTRSASAVVATSQITTRLQRSSSVLVNHTAKSYESDCESLNTTATSVGVSASESTKACNELRDAISDLRNVLPGPHGFEDEFAGLPTNFPQVPHIRAAVSTTSSDSSSPPPPPPMKSPSPPRRAERLVNE